ncbi:hypothetical protein LBMAG15_11280 [Actinomycetes bacterium]|nr:hypothetical protein LBMAG15_11280 [Actinomycetes bacterium]
MPIRLLCWGLAIAVAGGLGLMTAASAPASVSTVLVRGEPMKLRVLVYNIEYGGDKSTDQVIRKIDADVVGVLESYNRLPEIARKTGYPYYNVGLQLLSKYPILEPAGAGGLYSLIEVQPGYVIAFFNTHLDYVKYGPSRLARGVPAAQVLASENEVRAESIKILTPQIRDLVSSGYPVYLTGDLNTPSSLDYTKATVGSREGITASFQWPVSEALAQAGMRDTYREIHPNPVLVPGTTMVDPDFRKGGFGDRIDYIYAGGPSRTLLSTVVGESNGPDVGIGFAKWTSDHRAVLSTFRVTPVALRTTIALDRRMLNQGDALKIRYHAPGNSTTTIVVVPEGSDKSEAILTTVASESGATAVATSALPPDGYDILMLSSDGKELARNSFWVRSTTAGVDLRSGKDVYQVGEPIDISWQDGPANRWDWIGVYRANAANPNKDDYLLWGYVGGHDSGALPPQVFGSMALGAQSQGKPWPLPPGNYRIHYLLTDQYKSAGYRDITVTR